MLSLINAAGALADPNLARIMRDTPRFYDDDGFTTAGGVTGGRLAFAGITVPNQYGALVTSVLVENREAAAQRMAVCIGNTVDLAAIPTYALASTSSRLRNRGYTGIAGGPRGQIKSFNIQSNTSAGNISMTVDIFDVPGLSSVELNGAYYCRRGDSLFVRSLSTNSAIYVSFRGFEFNEQEEADVFTALMA